MPVLYTGRSGLAAAGGVIVPRSVGGLDAVARLVVPSLLRPPLGLANAGGAYYDTIMAETSLVSYWRLDETAGIFALDSKGVNGGTYVGSPTLAQTGVLVGDPDMAVKFPAAAQYVRIADDNSLDLGNGPYSIECWVNRTSTVPASLALLVSKAAQGNLYFVNDKLSGDVDGSPVVQEPTTTTDTGVWHHVVFTRSGTGTGNNKLYKDGVDVTTDGTGINDVGASNAAVMAIGVYNDLASFPSLSTIDEVAIYNAVLTLSQVQAHYVAAGYSVSGVGVPDPYVGGGYYGQAA